MHPVYATSVGIARETVDFIYYYYFVFFFILISFFPRTNIKNLYETRGSASRALINSLRVVRTGSELVRVGFTHVIKLI